LRVQLLDLPSLPLTVHAVMPLPLLHSLRWWSSSSYAHLHHHPSSSCLLESCWPHDHGAWEIVDFTSLKRPAWSCVNFHMSDIRRDH
jgi:hypothetical protein